MAEENGAAVAIKRLVFFGVLFVLWQGAYRSAWSVVAIPSPAATWSALSRGFIDHSIPLAAVASLRRVLIGYGLAVALGFGLGVAMAGWRIVQQTLGSLVLGMQTLPSICWLPLAMLWFGPHEQAVILVVILGSLFAITEASYSGLKQVPSLYRSAALTMGANQAQLLRRVLIPAALPSIITGMKLSWSFAWRSLMAGELLYSEVGLGQLLNRGRRLADMGGVVAIMIVIAAIGLLVNGAFFAPVERHVRRRWGVAV